MRPTARYLATALLLALTLALPAAIPAAAKEYVVQPGDNLTRIAASHGTTASALAARNGISNPNIIPGRPAVDAA